MWLGYASGALACGYANCWGAVGIGAGGAYGWSVNHSSEARAIGRLEAKCPSCDRWFTFVNTCGAIAMDPQGAWGNGWGDTRDLAEFYAVDTCEGYSNVGGCRPVVWACNGS